MSSITSGKSAQGLSNNDLRPNPLGNLPEPKPKPLGSRPDWSAKQMPPGPPLATASGRSDLQPADLAQRARIVPAGAPHDATRGGAPQPANDAAGQQAAIGQFLKTRSYPPVDGEKMVAQIVADHKAKGQDASAPQVNEKETLAGLRQFVNTPRPPVDTKRMAAEVAAEYQAQLRAAGEPQVKNEAQTPKSAEPPKSSRILPDSFVTVLAEKAARDVKAGKRAETSEPTLAELQDLLKRGPKLPDDVMQQAAERLAGDMNARMPAEAAKGEHNQKPALSGAVNARPTSGPPLSQPEAASSNDFNRAFDQVMSYGDKNLDKNLQNDPSGFAHAVINAAKRYQALSDNARNHQDGDQVDTPQTIYVLKDELATIFSSDTFPLDKLDDATLTQLAQALDKLGITDERAAYKSAESNATIRKFDDVMNHIEKDPDLINPMAFVNTVLASAASWKTHNAESHPDKRMDTMVDNSRLVYGEVLGALLASGKFPFDKLAHSQLKQLQQALTDLGVPVNGSDAIAAAILRRELLSQGLTEAQLKQVLDTRDSSASIIDAQARAFAEFAEAKRRADGARLIPPNSDEQGPVTIHMPRDDDGPGARASAEQAVSIHMPVTASAEKASATSQQEVPQQVRKDGNVDPTVNQLKNEKPGPPLDEIQMRNKNRPNLSRWVS